MKENGDKTMTGPRGWREFKVSELFDIMSTHALNYDLLQPNGDYPYVVRSAQNNGIRDFMNYDTAFLNEGNVITLGIDTASYFYQASDFFAGVKVKSLRLKHHELNPRLAMFLITLLQKQAGDYGYAGGKAFKTAELAEVLIELPVTQDGQPDYGWMSSYIRELENQRIRELDTYLQVTGLDDTTLTDNELQVLEQWRQHEKFGGTLLIKRFKVGDLFILKNTKAYNDLPDEMIISSNDNATVPFVTTQFNNNGIVGFSELQPLNSGNRITYSDTTTGDAIFYQSNAYIGRSHVIYMEPNFDGFNKYVAMFVMSLIRKQTSGHFDYGKKLNKQAMYDMFLELPITNDGIPDYDFMETFIRAQEKLVMQRLAKFRQLQIDTTRQII